MICDHLMHFTRNGANEAQTVTATAYTTNYVDWLAAGRGELGTGEELMGVFSIAAVPQGGITSLTFELRGSNTADGTTLTGTIVTLGASRALSAADLGIEQVSVTPAADDTFTATAHGLSAGDAVYIGATTTQPPGTSASTVYYVRTSGLTANAFTVSTTGAAGSVVDVTGAGSGAVFRRAYPAASGPAGLAVSVPVVVCIDPSLTQQGFRYLQGHITVSGVSVSAPIVGTLVTGHPDQQRYRSYPTSIVVS